MSDNYEMSKSLAPQSMGVETPYASRQYQWIPDSNGNSYQTSGLVPINFDLTSLIGDADTMIYPPSFYATIPVMLCTAYTSANTTGAALITPNQNTVSDYISTTLKPSINIIHQADCTINGTQADQPIPFKNIATTFKLMSQMSPADLAQMGPTLGISDTLDNVDSIKFNGSNQANYPTSAGAAVPFPLSSGAANVAASASTTAPTLPGVLQGNGVVNNVPYYTTMPSGGVSNDGNQGGVAQTANTFNKALNRRAARIIDFSANGNASQIYGNDNTKNIVSNDNLKQEMRPYGELQGSVYVWYDVLYVFLGDVFDVFNKMCHVRRMDARVTLYLNLGSTGCMLFNGSGNTSGQMIFSSSHTTIGGTCPYIDSFLGPVSNANATPVGALGKVTAISVCKPPGVCQFGVNFGGLNPHPMNQCRIYYEVCKFKPNVMSDYLKVNRKKQILYERMLYTPVANIDTQGFVNQLLTTGVKQIKSILVVPVISASVNGAVTSSAISAGSVLPFGQHQSPLDSFPMTTAPISLTNFQVRVGNQDVLAQPLYYTYQHFLEQFRNNCDAMNPGDYGLTQGLISEQRFNTGFRYYFISLERGSDSQQMDYRSVTVQFVNNSLQKIDCHIFVSYFQSATIDIETSEFKLL